MALFGRKNANRNNDSPKGENKQDPAQKDERIAGSGPEPAEESALAPSASAPAAEPQPEETQQEPHETQQTPPDRPAPEPFLPLSGVTAQPSPAPSAGGPSRYRTPEGFDFNRYFLAERRITLENVSYESQRAMSKQLHLNIRDTIVAQLLAGGVKVTYNRTLSFEPEGPFVLSVSFSVMLVFNPGTRGEVDWKTIDVAEEFKKNCPGLVSAMNAKIGLLVAEITNANGTPIFPPIVR